MQAQQICLLAARIAKVPGMVAIAGQMLNIVLENLKLMRDLKMNRVTTTFTLQAGTNGPVNLPTDYLRTYDMFYPLATPQGMTQFLDPITMEQYDAEFKPTQTANYPYEFATDLSTNAQAVSASGLQYGVTAVTVTDPGVGYLTTPGITVSPPPGFPTTPGTVMPLLAPRMTAVQTAGATNFGVGYTVGDILTVSGGVGVDRPTLIRVTGLAGGGTVANFEIFDGGSYLGMPGSSSTGTPNVWVCATTGGTGVNFTPLLSFGVGTPVIVTKGAGYTSAPTLTLSAGGIIPPAGIFGAMTATIGLLGAAGAGQLYVYPMSAVPLTITHRYMKSQPDITSPETSTVIPWFPPTQYLVEETAAMLMGIAGDEREAQFHAKAEKTLAPYLIMEGDEQRAVHSIRLDPRHFRQARSVRPTKALPY